MKSELLQAELEKEFEWFHRHPELSYQEYQTTARIKELLQKRDIEILDLALETGLVAVIRGKYPGPIVALRGDIDALPIGEETNLPWQSQNEGKMHACGHDFHLTSIYGTALLLKAQEENICGTIKLIFQPAEESSLGALKIIETGILDDVETIFGIHSSALLPVGTIGIKSGSITAAVDRFELELKGFGCHGAYPQEGHDSIVATGALIGALQSIVSRNVDPLDSGVLSITHVEAGKTWNVIPESAFLEGTIRTLNGTTRKLFEQRFKDITNYISEAYQVEAKIKWIAGPGSVVNDGKWTEFAKKVAQEADIEVVGGSVSLGGEDFAFYQDKIRGTFIQIGTGKTYPSHHPKFQVDPAALSLTSKYLSKLAINALIQLKVG